MPRDSASRIARYALHIRAAWKRLYPATYATLLAEGTLDEVSLRAADRALEELVLTRGRPKSEHEARSAAVEIWAVPPSSFYSWELTESLRRVIHHRWRRRWPEAWQQLSTEDVTLAVEPTAQAIQGGVIGGNEWFDVLPSALDQGAWIFDYLPRDMPPSRDEPI